MLEIRYLNSFRKDYKRAKKRGCDMSKLADVIRMLSARTPLPARFQDHQLKGKEFKGCRECHIEPGWLLVYRVIDNELILELLYTGTHSDLFWQNSLSQPQHSAGVSS